MLTACGGPDDPRPRKDGDDDTGEPAFPEQPHIIYIFPDQLRGDTLGCAGHPLVQTPHIDALAAEGVLFARCYTNGPSCRPARATMMTGLHVHQHGVQDNGGPPSPTLQSHVRDIHDAGYYTMVVGKTHLQRGNASTHLDTLKDTLHEWGFDDAVEMPDPNNAVRESAYSDYLTATTPEGETDKHRRLRDYIKDYSWDASPPDLPPTSLPSSDHADIFCGRTAADFIAAYDRDQPLYLQINFPGPHKPFDSTSEYRDLYDANDPAMPVPILVSPADPIAPLVETYIGIKWEAWTEQAARDLRVTYFGKVTMVDDGVGQVIAALKAAEMYDDAWIIVHSDHGELLADHMMTGKVTGYEGSTHVPLVIKPPLGLQIAWQDTGLVDSMDVVSSILRMAGLDATGFGDRDLTDRVLGGADGPLANEGKALLLENIETPTIRTETFKMAWDLGRGRPVEFYDLVADPDELVNLVFDPSRVADIDTLVQHLRGLRPLAVDNWTT